MNLYLDLFLTFAKVGVCTFGGGYAMLPILQREVVENKGWATEEELTDYFAIGQCTPGVIAVNTATFIGGILTTLGVVFPSLIIITLIAAFLSNFAHIPAVQHALAGVNACVVALIASSVIKLGKSTVKDGPTVFIYLVVLALAAGSSLLGFSGVLKKLASPAVLVVIAGVLGLCARRVLPKKQGGEGK